MAGKAKPHSAEPSGYAVDAGDIQCHLTDEWNRMRAELATAPRKGKGSTTRRLGLKRAMDENVELSNWIDREHIKRRHNTEVTHARNER